MQVICFHSVFNHKHGRRWHTCTVWTDESTEDLFGLNRLNEWRRMNSTPLLTRAFQIFFSSYTVTHSRALALPASTNKRRQRRKKNMSLIRESALDVHVNDPAQRVDSFANDSWLIKKAKLQVLKPDCEHLCLFFSIRVLYSNGAVSRESFLCFVDHNSQRCCCLVFNQQVFLNKNRFLNKFFSDEDQSSFFLFSFF